MAEKRGVWMKTCQCSHFPDVSYSRANDFLPKHRKAHDALATSPKRR